MNIIGVKQKKRRFKKKKKKTNHLQYFIAYLSYIYYFPTVYYSYGTVKRKPEVTIAGRN